MESIRNMLTNATEFTLWHIREPYEPLTPKSLNIHHACWSDFFLVDVFQVSNCKWKKEMILSGTNRMDGREKTLVADCRKSYPWLFTLSPWPLLLPSYTHLVCHRDMLWSVWPKLILGPGMDFSTSRVTHENLVTQYRDMSLNQPLGFWEIRGRVIPVAPADFASTT